MGNIIERLRQLKVGEDDFVYLNYEDRADIWHIADDYVQSALNETETAAMLAGILAVKGVTVYSRYEEDILGGMRQNGLLEDYDYEGWFKQYLTETIQESAYEWDLLTISTQRHDHKRGMCEIAANVKVRVRELVALEDDADSFVTGFEVIVQTPNGLLTLS